MTAPPWEPGVLMYFKASVDVTVCVVAVVQEPVAEREKAEDTGRALDRQNNQGYEHEVREEKKNHAPRAEKAPRDATRNTSNHQADRAMALCHCR